MDRSQVPVFFQLRASGRCRSRGSFDHGHDQTSVFHDPFRSRTVLQGFPRKLGKKTRGGLIRPLPFLESWWRLKNGIPNNTNGSRNLSKFGFFPTPKLAGKHQVTLHPTINPKWNMICTSYIIYIYIYYIYIYIYLSWDHLYYIWHGDPHGTHGLRWRHDRWLHGISSKQIQAAATADPISRHDVLRSWPRIGNGPGWENIRENHGTCNFYGKIFLGKSWKIPYKWRL